MENTDHAGGDQASPNQCVGTALSLGKGLTNAPNALFSNPAVNAESTAAESAECLDNRFFSGQNYPDPPTASNELCMPKGASKSYVDVGPGDPSRKLLTMRRKLMVKMKDFVKAPDRTSAGNFATDALQFALIQDGYDNFCDELKNINDATVLHQLSENMADYFDKCAKIYKRSELLFCHKSSNQSLLNDSDEDDVDPADSISQTTTNASGTSNTSSVLKRIELERKKAELQSLEQLNKLNARKAQFEAEARKAQFEADARKAQFEADARKAQFEADARKAQFEAEARKAQLEAEEASIKLRLETANLEAEEKMLACSERGSKIGSVSKSFTRSRWPGESSSKVQKKHGKLEPKIKIAKPGINLTDTVQHNPFVTAKVASYKEQILKDFENPSLNWQNESVETKPHFTCNMNFDSCTDARPRDRDTRAGINSAPDDEIKMRFDQRRSSAPSNNETALHEYLQRQGRNEYINLASQIGYDGQNIAFIFYENQIRRLMNESPYDERRLEVLRASCVGQPREMVNLFCAPMKSITTSQRIEKALGRLRQRYGVSGGLTSEPKIIAIRNGSKVAFNASSMKMYNEDLNTLEVYAFAHDEVDKLSGQLLIDTASRLPNLLKRRYLDYLDKKGLI